MMIVKDADRILLPFKLNRHKNIVFGIFIDFRK